MPIFNAPLQAIDQKECKRYAGLSASTDFPEDLIHNACIEAQTLIVPRGIWQVYPYNNESNTILAPKPIQLTGEGIIKHLKSAKKIAVMAATIGYELETAVTKHFSAGEYTQGLLLDAAGTTAVEANCDYLETLIRQEAAREGLSTVFRFSPGYGNWSITVQQAILELADGEKINLHVTPASILTPRKSVTAVIGLIPPQHTQIQSQRCSINSCENCTLIDCLARKEIK